MSESALCAFSLLLWIDECNVLSSLSRYNVGCVLSKAGKGVAGTQRGVPGPRPQGTKGANDVPVCLTYLPVSSRYSLLIFPGDTSHIRYLLLP